MFNKEDYTKILDRARKKRNNNVYIRYLLIGAVVALVIGLVILVSSLVKDRTSGDDGPGQEVARTVEEPATVEITVDEEALRQSEEARLEQERQEKEAADRQAVVDAYANLGMVQVSGYLNVRRSPDSRGDIIGKMQENSVCDILDQEGDWYHIRSGQVEGYISSQYVITGEEARALALEQVKLR